MTALPPLQLDFYLPQAFLKPVLILSFLTSGVLAVLFYYLCRYTRERYYGWWAGGWGCYMGWLLCWVSQLSSGASPHVLILGQWSLGTAAVLLMGGMSRFFKQKIRQTTFGLFCGFLLVWCSAGSIQVIDPFLFQTPMFLLLALASMMAAWFFWQHHCRSRHAGAGLLAVAYFLWAICQAALPLLLQSEHLVCTGLLVASALQLLITLSMVVLVMEELRASVNQAAQTITTQRGELATLRATMNSMENRYRALFDQAHEGIVIVDARDLDLKVLNQTARQLLGLPGEVPVSGSLKNFLQVVSSADMASQFAPARVEEPVPHNGPEWFDWILHHPQVSLVRLDGGTRLVEIRGAAIVYQDRPAYQYFIREMTDRGRLEQQLRQAEKLSALGQMISGIAHELNNPLAVVKGYLELVLGRHPLDPQTRLNLEKAMHESNRATKIVGNLLTFARQRPPALQPVNLNELILQVLDLRQFELKAMGTNLKLELAPQLPMTQVDPDQIQQVLVNLVNNALQAMADLPGPGRLQLSSGVVGKMIQLKVEDSGPGVPDHLVNRIFEPFFTTKEVGTGTGLGLSISHTIMTDIRGRIYCQHSALGGACFALEFPVTDGRPVPPAAPAPPTPALETASHAAASSPRLLILDDEKAIAEMLGEMLGLIGYSATLAHAAPQALELIEQQTFDLILSDIRMPIMDGRKFFQIVKRRHPDLARRIVFLTGDVVNEETQAFLKSTGNPHLGKPFRLAEVEEVVGMVLRQEGCAGVESPALAAD